MVLGGGLIGGALVDRLRERGHAVLLATRRGHARPGVDRIALDLEALPPDATLRSLFDGVDVLVNTVGIFRAAGQQDFDAVHVNGPRQVVGAARAAGVGRVVQLSALGANPASPLPYFASKGRMDAWLLEQGGDVAVVRPSLVFAPSGASTRWFAQLASLPLTPLPAGGAQPVHPVHLGDLLDTLVMLVEREAVPAMLDVVGPRAVSLRDYLALFREAMGSGGMFLPIPPGIARLAASIGAKLAPGLPLDADALAMLDAGNTADAAPIARWLGRAPLDPADFIEPGRAAAMRNAATLSWTVPLMRIALAIMWLATGVVSLWVYPREDSLAMLAQVGLQGAMATAALWTGAIADLALGIALLAMRHRAPVYLLQIALVAGYTVIITLWLPEQWAHPFGPVLKNLPLLAMTLALLVLDRPHGPDRR